MDFICDTKVLCTLLKVEPRTVRDLVSRGILERVSRGRFNLKQAIPSYITYKLNVELSRHGTGALLAERTRLTKANADHKLLDLELKEGNLIDVSIAMQL